MKVRIRNFKDKGEIEGYLLKLGNTTKGAEILSKKSEILLLEIDGIDTRGANILKQDAISVGGDCSVPRSASLFKPGKWKVLLIVNERELEKLLKKLKEQPFRLKELSSLIEKALENYHRESFKIEYRGKVLELSEPVVMGILNVTPDSFSDGGMFNRVELAVKRCEEMLEEGAEIIDVGGESTRPGSEPVPEDEEIKRVIPIIEEIRKKLGDKFFISIDTYKSSVAKEALLSGADIVNDISGFRFDEKMVEVVAEYNCPAVISHIKGKPKDMQKNPYYEDVMGEIIDYLETSIEMAVNKGVDREKLIVDHGIGFGKRLEDNLCILRNLNQLKVLGRPILVGASRKSFIGKVTGVEEQKKRLPGSLAAAVVAVLKGAKIVRAHDVRETVEAIKLAYEIEGVNC
jgi:dihydropteroate synthase